MACYQDNCMSLNKWSLQASISIKSMWFHRNTVILVMCLTNLVTVVPGTILINIWFHRTTIAYSQKRAIYYGHEIIFRQWGSNSQAFNCKPLRYWGVSDVSWGIMLVAMVTVIKCWNRHIHILMSNIAHAETNIMMSPWDLVYKIPQRYKARNNFTLVYSILLSVLHVF